MDVRKTGQRRLNLMFNKGPLVSRLRQLISHLLSFLACPIRSHPNAVAPGSPPSASERSEEGREALGFEGGDHFFGAGVGARSRHLDGVSLALSGPSLSGRELLRGSSGFFRGLHWRKEGIGERLGRFPNGGALGDGGLLALARPLGGGGGKHGGGYRRKGGDALGGRGGPRRPPLLSPPKTPRQKNRPRPHPRP